MATFHNEISNDIPNEIKEDNNKKSMEYYKSFNLYNNLFEAGDKNLLFITLYGDIIFCDGSLMKLCSITNPISSVFADPDISANSDFVKKNGLTRGIINKKYIVIFNKNDLYVAKLPDLGSLQELNNLNLEWTISNNPYKTANCNYSSIGSYGECNDKFYVVLEGILYYYVPNIDKWYIIQPNIENTININENPLDKYIYNKDNKNLIYHNYETNLNYIMTKKQNIELDDSNANGTGDIGDIGDIDNVRFINKLIENAHNKITHIFAISTANNLVVIIDNGKIKTISLEDYILDFKEDKWIEREILNNLKDNIMDNLEFIVSCTIFKNNLIIATYKNLYYCYIGIWWWCKMHIEELPESHKSHKSTNIFTIKEKIMDKEKEKENIIESGLRNIWSNVHCYDSDNDYDDNYRTKAITIDGRIFMIVEVLGNLIGIETYVGNFKIIDILQLNWLINDNTIFMNKYKITFDNFQEEYNKLNRQFKLISNSNENTENTDNTANTENTKILEAPNMTTTEVGATGDINSITTETKEHITTEYDDINTTTTTSD